MEVREYKAMAYRFSLTEEEVEIGTFRGYASVFDVVDSYNEIVRHGAFKRSLKNKKSFPLLWAHDTMQPIGKATGVEDNVGLLIEGHLNMDVQKAVETRALMMQTVVNGLSIGFQTVKESIDKVTGARALDEINLWEISPLVFQACPDAVISEVKGIRFTPPHPLLAINEKLCENCKALLEEDPRKLTPPQDPPSDTGNPGKYLHLLDGLIFKT